MYKRKSEEYFRLRGIIVVLVFTMFMGMTIPAAAMSEAAEGEEGSALEKLGEVDLQSPVVEKVQLDGAESESEQALTEIEENNGIVLFAASSEETEKASAIPAPDSSNVVLTYNKIIRHEDWFTRNFTISYNGKTKVAYCIEPKDAPPDKGSHTAVRYDNRMMTKVLYYCYGYPGYEKNTKQYLAKCTLSSDYKGDDGAYVISHLLLSYFYDGKNSSSDAFKGLSASTRSLIASMAADLENNWPEVPQDASLSFDITQADAQWNKNKQIQETPVLTLNGHKDNKVSVPIPQGATMIKLSNNELTEYAPGSGGETDTQQMVDIYGGDEFYFTAPASMTGHFESGQLIGSLQEFQPYLIKVSDKQDIMYCGDGARDSVSFSVNWIDVGTFVLNKISASPEITENNEEYSLEGAEYEVYDENGALYGEIVTDVNGKGQIMLPHGDYTLKEKAAPMGYAVDLKELSITVADGENVLEHKEQILPKEKTRDDSPKTGDDAFNYIVIWCIAGAAALVAGMSLAVGMRRR